MNTVIAIAQTLISPRIASVTHQKIPAIGGDPERLTNSDLTVQTGD